MRFDFLSCYFVLRLENLVNKERLRLTIRQGGCVGRIGLPMRYMLLRLSIFMNVSCGCEGDEEAM